MSWPIDDAVGLHIQLQELPAGWMPGFAADVTVNAVPGAFTIDASSVPTDTWYTALETLGHVGVPGSVDRWTWPGAPRWTWFPQRLDRADAIQATLPPTDNQTARTRIKRHRDRVTHAVASLAVTPTCEGASSAAWTQGFDFLQTLTARLAYASAHQPPSLPQLMPAPGPIAR